MSDVPWCYCEDEDNTCSLVFPDFESAVLESFIAVSYGEISFEDVPAKHRDETRPNDFYWVKTSLKSENLIQSTGVRFNLLPSLLPDGFPV